MSKNENRLNFRMTDETATKIERWYQEDNCRSKNEFIEKAVNCYADMLAAGESTTLPRAVQSAIDSRLKLFEDRIASLLYKQAVEMDMAMSILLQSLNVSEEVLRQERAKSRYISYGSLRLDIFAGCAYLGSANLQLTQKEFAVLLLLVRNAGRTVSKQEVLMEAWNTTVEDDSRALWTLISRLRRKLNSQESRIEISSKRGDGYTLEQI